MHWAFRKEAQVSMTRFMPSPELDELSPEVTPAGPIITLRPIARQLTLSPRWTESPARSCGSGSDPLRSGRTASTCPEPR